MGEASWVPSALLALASAALYLRPEHALPVFVLVVAALASPVGLEHVSRQIACLLDDEHYRRGLRDAFADMLCDNAVESAARKMLKGAIIDSVVDETLQKNLAIMIREAVADAIGDEKFMKLFRDAFKDSLRDQDLHRAAIEGTLGALNPFRRRGGDEDETRRKSGASSASETATARP